MATSRFPNRPFDLREAFWLIRQDIGGNASLVGWELVIDKVSTSPTFSGLQTYQDMRIDGNLVNSARWNGFDFRGGGPWQILRGENWVGHNGDGTKTFSINGHANFDVLGATNVYSQFTLPTIPRASTGRFPYGDAFDAGTNQTIFTYPASGDFRHTIDWYFGSRGGRALTEIGGDGTWSVPLDLIDQIPNDTTGVGKIRTHTYDRPGGNMIGWNETNFRIYVPGNIGPTISGAITASEANTVVAAQVGKYVQNKSALKVNIGTSSSQYGAGISSGKVDIIKNGVSKSSVPGMSGTTSVLTDSGQHVVRGTVTDTRGRTTTKDITVDVLPYSQPVISSYSVSRFKKTGLTFVPDPESGQYVRVSVNTSVSSLVNVTERNFLNISVQTRQRGESDWITRKSLPSTGVSYNSSAFIEKTFGVTNRSRSANIATITTSTSHGLEVGDYVTISGTNNAVFNGSFEVTEISSATTFKFVTSTSGTVAAGTTTGTVATPVKFSAQQAHDIRVEITDRFSNLGAQTTLSVGAVFMHWSTGLGVGKFYEKGQMDVAGPIYMEGAPVTAGPVGALLDPTYFGPGPAKVIFLNTNTMSTQAYEWVGKYSQWGNPVVNMVRVDGTWKILGHANDSNTGGKISLKQYLGTNYRSYNENQSLNEYNEPRAQLLSSGIVVLSGLLSLRTTYTPGETILTLPVGYRPDANQIFHVDNSGNHKAINVGSNGIVRWETTPASGAFGDYVSIDNIAYPAAGVATWTNITEWANGWGAWNDPAHVPAYWKDPYGVVWFKGLVSGGTKGSDTVMFKIPATHSPGLQTHNATATDLGFGYVSAFPTTAPNGGDRSVAWKSNNPSNASWLSLSPIRIVSPDAYLAHPWSKSVATGNNWETSYGASFPPLSVSRRPDGLAITEGLIKAGNGDAIIAQLQDWVSPEKTAIIRGVGADQTKRFDIWGLNVPQRRGALWASGPHTAWSSVDGFVWMVGD